MLRFIILCGQTKGLKLLSHVQLCNPTDYSPQTPLYMGFPSRNTGVVCHFFLQEFFPTQGSNPSLPCGRQILCHWATREAQSYSSTRYLTFMKLLKSVFYSLLLKLVFILINRIVVTLNFSKELEISLEVSACSFVGSCKCPRERRSAG